MTDQDQLRRLLADYCHLLDDRRIDDWLGLFADDAVVRMGRHEFTGRDGVRRWIDGVIEASGEPGRHLCANPALDVDGDGAAGRTDFAYVAPGPVLAQVGRYDDEFRRIDGRWRFVRHEVSFLRPPS